MNRRLIWRKGILLDVEDGPQTAEWNFWQRYASGSWAQELFEFIDLIIPDDGLLLDVGAWVGLVTLAAGQRVRVIAIEPDPVAYRQLAGNVEANHLQERVQLIEAAASLNEGWQTLWSGPRGWGRSHSSVTRETGIAVVVPTIDLRVLIEERQPDLVKIDIEGGEVRLLPELGPVMRKLGIPLYLASHPGFFGCAHTGRFDQELGENWLALWRDRNSPGHQEGLYLPPVT